MKLEEAIKELKGIPEHNLTPRDALRTEGIKLGIEALKRRLQRPERTIDGTIVLLPGETEE